MDSLSADIVIVGTGIAGLRAALELAPHCKVLILSKGKIHDGSSSLAQGGIAAAMHPGDTPDYHYQDTLAAGAGLCNEKAVRILVEEGLERVKELMAWGTRFDTDMGHEAAHHHRRILHAGDTTGREIEKVLGNRALAESNIKFLEFTSAYVLRVEDGRVQGLYTLDLKNGRIGYLACRAVLIATGGYGQLYSHNTNPAVNTGDGLAVAYRAGAALTDLEFVQFHPTTLYHGDKKPVSIFLISEAVRGEGALLRNIHGETFMQRYDSRLELAPRDIVARAIYREIHATQAPHVYLDLSGIKVNLADRFPNIYQRCLEVGIDIQKDFIPVAPAAHYCMGGVLTNVYGESSLPGLLVAGEAASVGVHGANRLASNSLLEGLVFGQRAAQRFLEQLPRLPLPGSKASAADLAEQGVSYNKTSALTAKQSLRELMWRYVGIERREDDLRWALLKFDMLHEKFQESTGQPETFELQNMILIARLATQAALNRRESRGAHYRTDFPQASPEFEKHMVCQKDLSGVYGSLAPTFDHVAYRVGA